jgi:hypothetical protein
MRVRDSYELSTKKYRQTYQGLKSHRKSEWKTKSKMIFYDFDKSYDYFIQQEVCELCNGDFNNKNRKCQDHHHHSRYNRFVCCNRCNIKLAKIDKIKDILHLELYRYFLRL